VGIKLKLNLLLEVMTTGYEKWVFDGFVKFPAI